MVAALALDEGIVAAKIRDSGFIHQRDILGVFVG
jgi:hypothetical protein